MDQIYSTRYNRKSRTSSLETRMIWGRLESTANYFVRERLINSITYHYKGEPDVIAKAEIWRLKENSYTFADF